MVKKLPPTENGPGVICRAADGTEYHITQDPARKRHTLWRVCAGGFEKLKTAESPYDLYSVIPGF